MGSPTRGGKTSPQDPCRTESCCAGYKCEPSAKNATASLWKRDDRTRQKTPPNGEIFLYIFFVKNEMCQKVLKIGQNNYFSNQ